MTRNHWRSGLLVFSKIVPLAMTKMAVIASEAKQSPANCLLGDVLRGQHADFVAVGEFDLDRRMVDAEALLELARDLAERRVAGMAARHHQMAGQRRLGR